VIWPNPFRYKVAVQEPNLKALTVYNVLGQKVLATEKNECIINHALPTGVYFFRVETVSGKVYMLKGLYVR